MAGPLELPEILAIILQFADWETLVAAAQVNSLWNHEATNRIWRGNYRDPICLHAGAFPLTSIAKWPQERREWYTEKIRYLSIPGNSYDLITSHIIRQRIFSLPNLKYMRVILQCEHVREEDLVQFLSPNLVCLHIKGDDCTRWFFEQIKRRSPRLQSLIVGGMLKPKNLTTDDFLDFLTSMTSIRHLSAPLDWIPDSDGRIIRHLLLRSNLELLNISSDEFGPQSTPHKVIEALQTNDPFGDVFPWLRYLSVDGRGEMHAFLLPKLRHLQGVSIDVSDIAFEQQQCYLLDCFSVCSRLESVILEGSLAIPAQTFLHIAARCPLMRRFVVGGCGLDENDCFPDWIIDKLASSWRQLEILLFQLSNTNFSVESLISLSRNCPHLQVLNLPTKFEICDRTAVRPEISFPSLTRLAVTGVTFLHLDSKDEIESAYDQITFQLDTRFPVLLDVLFRSDNLHGRMFLEKVRNYLYTSREHEEQYRPNVSDLLTERLIEPIPGSRYNPLT